MSKEKRRVPKLRFPGFTEDWEQCKLTDIAKTFIGLVTTMTENYRDSGTLLIRNSDIKEGQFIFSEKPIHLDEEFAEKNKTRRLQIGDVVTVHTGDIGTSAVIEEKEDGAIGFATINTRTDQRILNPYFLSTYFNTEKHKCYANSVSTGDGRSNYNIKDFNKLVISIPTLDEQERISLLINNINTIITLHQRKLNNLKLKKKALLQKLFPKNGERYPELRFSGFTDAWEQRKLGEVVKSYSGGTPTASNKEYYGGDIPFIRSAEINSDTTELYITQKGLDNSSAKIVEKGTILYAMYGATSGEVGISKINGAINQAILAMIPLDYNGKIIAQYLRKNKESIIGKYLQGGQGNLSANIILELPIQLPGLEESNQIANFLESFDKIITLHQRKLDHLQLQKKALLQQMFV